MAVVQISRIQQRKGLQQDLPALASAEFGWSLDTRRLYIGNGTIAEGAPVQGITEILTQYSDILNISNNYTFKGAQTGYTSLTGATALTPTQRTQQQKLDDIVNVRDFGAAGNGSTDDTAAIQRAIDQVYFGNFAVTTARLRRQIFFPAGTYLITGALTLPSYAILVGEGKDRSIIQQSGVYAVITLKDTAGGTGTSYALGGTPAHDISIRDMTLTTTQTGVNLVTLDVVNNVEFTRVKMLGATNNSSSTVTTGQNAVYARPYLASRGNITNVTFTECEFLNCDQGLIINAYTFKMIGCLFNYLSRGITVDVTASTATTENIKVIGCTFDQIGRSAIYAVDNVKTDNLSIMSTMNYFGEVGNGYNGAGYAITPVIQFAGSHNYSVSDYFVRSDADAYQYSRVQFQTQGLQVGLDSQTGLTMGSFNMGAGRMVSLTSSQTNANTGIVFSGVYGAYRMQYWLQNTNQTAYRTGFIDININGVNVQYVDEYMEYPNATNFTYPGPTGVTFTVYHTAASTANLAYTSTSTGSGNLTYIITSLRQ